MTMAGLPAALAPQKANSMLTTADTEMARRQSARNQRGEKGPTAIRLASCLCAIFAKSIDGVQKAVLVIAGIAAAIGSVRPRYRGPNARSPPLRWLDCPHESWSWQPRWRPTCLASLQSAASREPRRQGSDHATWGGTQARFAVWATARTSSR